MHRALFGNVYPTCCRRFPIQSAFAVLLFLLGASCYGQASLNAAQSRVERRPQYGTWI